MEVASILTEGEVDDGRSDCAERDTGFDGSKEFSVPGFADSPVLSSKLQSRQSLANLAPVEMLKHRHR